MMRIVHAALRRDLERARVALTREPPPDDRQRRAIAGHLDWLMAFLEAHHRSEDLGLYPVVRERRPGAAALLDDMARDHRAVAVAIEDLRGGVGDLRPAGRPPAGGRRHRPAGGRVGPAPRTGGGRGDAGGLPGHHRPGVAGDRAGAQPRRQVDGAARPGGALADRRRQHRRIAARVLGLVPPVQRLVLLYGFAPSYRRYRRACWDPHRRRVQHQGVHRRGRRRGDRRRVGRRPRPDPRR